jgi:hypothetical protein
MKKISPVKSGVFGGFRGFFRTSTTDEPSAAEPQPRGWTIEDGLEIFAPLKLELLNVLLMPELLVTAGPKMTGHRSSGKRELCKRLSLPQQTMSRTPLYNAIRPMS